jgi:hypothetical protein
LCLQKFGRLFPKQVHFVNCYRLWRQRSLHKTY